MRLWGRARVCGETDIMVTTPGEGRRYVRQFNDLNNGSEKFYRPAAEPLPEPANIVAVTDSPDADYELFNGGVTRPLTAMDVARIENSNAFNGGPGGMLSLKEKQEREEEEERKREQTLDWLERMSESYKQAYELFSQASNDYYKSHKELQETINDMRNAAKLAADDLENERNQIENRRKNLGIFNLKNGKSVDVRDGKVYDRTTGAVIEGADAQEALEIYKNKQDVLDRDKQEIEEKRRQLKEFNNKIDEIENQNKKFQSKIDELNHKKERGDLTEDDLRQEIRKIQEEIDRNNKVKEDIVRNAPDFIRNHYNQLQKPSSDQAEDSRLQSRVSRSDKIASDKAYLLDSEDESDEREPVSDEARQTSYSKTIGGAAIGRKLQIAENFNDKAMGDNPDNSSLRSPNIGQEYSQPLVKKTMGSALS